MDREQSCVKEGLLLFRDTGEVTPGFYVTGIAWSPVCLLDGESPALFEGGIACASNLYLDSIRRILGDRMPEWMFLTHVHWDHCGAIGLLRQAFPSLKIAASKRASEIVTRPNAVKLMTRLNHEAKRYVQEEVPGIDSSLLDDLFFQPFTIDQTLAGGQTVCLGNNLTIRVIATPGHTRDHLSYYIPEKGILIASEASGCLDATGKIICEFVADFESYLESLRKMQALDAEILYQGHRLLFVGRDEVRAFLVRSVEETERFGNYVTALLKEEGGQTESVVMRIKAEMWDTNPGPKQPEAPYLLNLRAQVSHLAERLARRR